MEGSDEGVRCDSTKLMKMGFEYTYDTKKILDDSVACARRLGSLIKWPFRVLEEIKNIFAIFLVLFVLCTFFLRNSWDAKVNILLLSKFFLIGME